MGAERCARRVSHGFGDRRGTSIPAGGFLTSSYRPRASVYETLPGFMLRLDNREVVGNRLHEHNSPTWFRIAGGQGSYTPDHSLVGAAYDFGRFEAEAGVEFDLSREENVTGWASLRHTRGSADVSAPTGGGKIEAMGYGTSFGLSWQNAKGYYTNGLISMTRYETDLSADGRGVLVEGADAMVHSLGVEAGRRFSFVDNLSLTPRAWSTYSDVSMDGFRDVVGSRVSLLKSARSIVGLGIVTEYAHSLDGSKQQLILHGRLGLEQVLGDAETVADVSRERLVSKAPWTRGCWTWAQFTAGNVGRWAEKFPPPDWGRMTEAMPPASTSECSSRVRPDHRHRAGSRT